MTVYSSASQHDGSSVQKQPMTTTQHGNAGIAEPAALLFDKPHHEKGNSDDRYAILNPARASQWNKHSEINDEPQKSSYNPQKTHCRPI